MTLYDYTKCPQCKASIAKTARACPICGREQGAGAKCSASSNSSASTKSPTTPTAPSYSNPYKTTSKPSTSYTPAASPRKNSDAALILGSVLAIGVFVVCLIAGTHHSVPVASTALPTVATTPAPTDAATPPMTDAEFTAKLRAFGQELRAANVREPSGNTNATQIVGIITYCGVVSTDAQLVADAENSIGEETKKFDANPQVITDPAWKDAVRQKLTRIDQVTTAAANIPIVPPECGELNQNVRALAFATDSGFHDLMNGIMDQNQQEYGKGQNEIQGTVSLVDAINKNMDDLKSRYMR